MSRIAVWLFFGLVSFLYEFLTGAFGYGHDYWHTFDILALLGAGFFSQWYLDRA